MFNWQELDNSLHTFSVPLTLACLMAMAINVERFLREFFDHQIYDFEFFKNLFDVL